MFSNTHKNETYTNYLEVIKMKLLKVLSASAVAAAVASTLVVAARL